MERIDPVNFYGPRAYFTDIDYKIVYFRQDRDAYNREVERRLKILLLTKNIIVCAASHLTHEFAYNFLKDNSILLEKSMIIPALRRDKQHITDYLEDKRIKRPIKKRMMGFYEDYVNQVVDWELMENTTWFRENLLKALKDERSVIRRNLFHLPKSKLNSLISEIERNEILTREIILQSISTWTTREQKILLNFVNMLYHISGSRVVNCESALPQENYIDYSLADFSKHRTTLSETQVFVKIFFELAFETLYKNTLPVELLNVLTFEDIYYLRKPIEKSSFRKKYEELIQKSIQIIKISKTESQSIGYDMEKSLETLEQISKPFEEIFKQELPEFLKRKHTETSKELRKIAPSLGLGIAGLVPYVPNIASAISLAQSSRGFFVNLNQYFRTKKEINDYNLYLKNKEKMLRQLIEKYTISEKSTLLDALDLLTRTISMKIKL